jgi:nitrate reductase gamma subunit
VLLNLRAMEKSHSLQKHISWLITSKAAAYKQKLYFASLCGWHCSILSILIQHVDNVITLGQTPSSWMCGTKRLTTNRYIAEN